MSTKPTFQPDNTNTMGGSSNQLQKDDFHKTNLVPLHRTDFSMDIISKWSEVRSIDKPKRRSHHTSFISESYLYIVGGVDISDIKQEDIHRINLDSEKPQWELITPKGIPMRKIAYHAGALINNNYFFFGGQTDSLQTSNTMWNLNIKDFSLEVILYETSLCPPLESHSCDVYENKLIFYGGHKDKVLNGDIYCFNPENSEFVKLSEKIPTNSRPLPRQEHSTLIINDDLYIFGGVGKDDLLFNDMWTFNLKSNAFTQINYDAMDKNMIPAPRLGHSMIQQSNNELYIFGGFLGLVNESNELWKYDIAQNKYTLLHDSIAEKFSNEDLEKTRKSFEDQSKTKKKFRWLSKHEVELKTNPLPFSMKGNKNKNSQSNTVQKNTSLTDIKTAHSNDVLIRPNAIKMKKSLIYTSTEDDLNCALGKLSRNEKSMTCFDGTMTNANGKLPEPRDGHSMLVYKEKFVVFGGDRNKFPFNDLYYFTLN